MSKAPANVDVGELTVVARRVLLDGLTALRSHLNAITVVGAQAVHLRTESAAIASSRTRRTATSASIQLSSTTHHCSKPNWRRPGFAPLDADQPGLWVREELVGGKSTPIELDLLVGASFAKGRRSARIPPHNKMAARRVDGLETAAVDRSPMVIRPLEPEDDRAMTVNVAGPTALLVAKAYKINDRLEKASSKPGRVVDKDAGDVVRIMMTHQPKAIATAFAELTADPRVGSIRHRDRAQAPPGGVRWTGHAWCADGSTSAGRRDARGSDPGSRTGIHRGSAMRARRLGVGPCRRRASGPLVRHQPCSRCSR